MSPGSDAVEENEKRPSSPNVAALGKTNSKTRLLTRELRPVSQISGKKMFN